LAELHHSRAARIRVAGGGAGGDAPDAQASALGLPYGQPQPPKRLSPSWDTTNHSGVQREVSEQWRSCRSGAAPPQAGATELKPASESRAKVSGREPWNPR